MGRRQESKSEKETPCNTGQGTGYEASRTLLLAFGSLQHLRSEPSRRVHLVGVSVDSTTAQYLSIHFVVAATKRRTKGNNEISGGYAYNLCIPPGIFGLVNEKIFHVEVCYSSHLREKLFPVFLRTL